MSFFTFAIGLLCVSAMLVAVVRTRDTFHPAVVLAPMFFFLYAYLPFNLEREDGFRGFLTSDDVDFAQRLNLIGIAALMIGIFVGARVRGTEVPEPAYPPQFWERITRAGWVMGAVGLIGYVVSILNVGGVSQAYGVAYGGGWSDSGYIRESVLMALPALLFVGLNPSARRGIRFWLINFVIAAPLLLHGIFGARRGPTFMAAAGMGVAWYMGRRARPRLLVLISAGIALGALLLFLVSNRQSIYIGSEDKLDNDATMYLRPGTGNEFIYGAGTLIHYDITSRFTYGARYFAIIFIRPIPRAIWPSKYVFVSQLFDVPNLEKNLGTDATSFEDTLGWQGAVGAAPGIVADMFIEFGYLYWLALGLLGFAFGVFWRKAVYSGGVWIPVYCVLVSLSLYMVMQALEALLFRFLLMTAPTIIAWRWAKKLAPAPESSGTSAIPANAQRAS